MYCYVIPRAVMDKVADMANDKSVLDGYGDRTDYYNGNEDDAFELGFEAGKIAVARMVANDARKF